MKQPISEYLQKIEEALLRGNATEHTHRPALKRLIESLAPGVEALNEPKRVSCGAPDFVVSRSDGLILGYMEAKDIGKSLDEAGRSEQLRRYTESLDNLILTDYLEFRWYVGGEFRRAARIATPDGKGKLSRSKDAQQEVVSLLQDFLSRQPVPVSSPKELSERMARFARLIRDIIVEAFRSGASSHLLRDLRRAFADTLIPDLDQPEKVTEFADMYAQTLAYGLFAARCNHKENTPFQRSGATAEIPKTNPFLRNLFSVITGPDFDEEPYAGYVNDLVQLPAHADMNAILSQFGERTRREDPVVHFYETFLASYDSRLREVRGVYYTPEPVVSYIVRSVDALLRTRFGLSQGLADTSGKMLLLDPACGTGTFLYAVVDHIREQFAKQNNAGLWSGYVRDCLLKNLFGFELLMAPYAVAHLKLGMQLAGQDLSEAQRKQWAYDFSGDDRLQVYLTNTLEEQPPGVQIPLYGPFRVITEEARASDAIKRDRPILVVLGNPPYSGHSANRSRDEKGKLTFIGKLIEDYKQVDGKPLGEKNPKWLQDDYVKFIRWAQWRIERTEEGILGFITNHGYLDNPTFRGMRQQLMQSFNEIYVYDLHGNVKKKEKSPDGGSDC